MDSKEIGANIGTFLADNGTSLLAGAAVIGGAVAVYKAGTLAVTTACLIGGGIAAVAVGYIAAKSAIDTSMVIAGELGKAVVSVKEQMSQPRREQPRQQGSDARVVQAS